MKILCLQGSPRKRGSTNRMLSWVQEALTASGHEAEQIDLATKDIGGCIGCYTCQRDPDELICARQDEGNTVLDAIADADAVIYATPLYCWGFSAQFKGLIDRHLSFVTNFMDPEKHRSHVEGKTMALLVTCGGEDVDGNTDCIKLIWQRLTAFGKCDPVYELIVPGCTSAKSLGDEQKAWARELAEKSTA